MVEHNPEPPVYRPVAGLAVAGLGVSALFAVLVLAVLAIAIYSGSPLLLPWLLLLGVVGAGLSLAGRRRSMCTSRRRGGGAQRGCWRR